MRPYLALDTSTALGSVAVGRGDRLLAEVVVGVTVRHSEALLPAIDYALRSAGVEPAGLGGVVVGGGPGSFTGVRVAAATAKGLVRVLGVPLFAYSGLEALAAGVGACSGAGLSGNRAGGAAVPSGLAAEAVVQPRPVCALFDARREEVYAACYRFDAGGIETLLEPSVLPLDSVMSELRAVDPIYAGDGALRYRDLIEGAGGGVAPAFCAVPRGGALLWLADLDPEAGRVAEPAVWEPEYLRAAGAERGAAR
jgi:tRNA threonylcarbamoyladenosine biosynthesis protein TsaB